MLVPIFEKQSGYTIKTIGVGSGMAMEMGRRGQADVLLVHSPKDEEKLVKDGFGLNRRAVMHNDFILIGPISDPAGAKTVKNIGEAFKRISESGSLFISRGDRSGTHSKELSIWPYSRAQISNLWYLESGQGMGATLLIADQKNAYTLADRATYLSYKNKIKLAIIREGDKLLLNPYHVIEINPAKHKAVNSEGSKAFSDFIVSPAVQKLIADFGRDKFGQSLFFKDATR
jgi:tungstate transport system substrate-binding protein